MNKIQGMNHIQKLTIENFKSIRHVSLEGERVNIFLGKPNAGKSNILEAISLLGAGFMPFTANFMAGFLRYKSINHLFNDYNLEKRINVKADDVSAKLSLSPLGYNFSITGSKDIKKPMLAEPFQIEIDAIGNIFQSDVAFGSFSHVKKYNFQSFDKTSIDDLHLASFLIPPYGDNFYYVAQSNPELKAEIQRFLRPNGLEFLFDVEANRMDIVRRDENTLLRFPMALVPDTFQRYIFHIAAILSNKDSVILFEEPETHSYAPYVYQLAQHIAQDERNNQYFLTTHNPYFLLPLLQEVQDVAVFSTWFENYQTKVRRLSEEEIRSILNEGIDVFLNLESVLTP
ncbi:MAG: AAA family ATPase [Saprospiraceae bacterium]|nr:AAA family ATPase [Saprospiraceae bacterium]